MRLMKLKMKRSGTKRTTLRHGIIALLTSLALLGTQGCKSHDPKTAVKMSELETYWVVDPSVGGKTLVAPAVRFVLENVSPETLVSVETTAAFRIAGQKDAWGSGYARLTEGRKTVASGTKTVVTMSSDARYTLTGDVSPAQIFANKGFRPVNVTFFVRVGSSPWAEFGKLDVENVIGSKSARAVTQKP